LRGYLRSTVDLMDPLDAGLHKIAAPLYQHGLADRDALNEELLRAEKIWAARDLKFRSKLLRAAHCCFIWPMACGKLLRQTPGNFRPARNLGARRVGAHDAHGAGEFQP